MAKTRVLRLQGDATPVGSIVDPPINAVDTAGGAYREAILPGEYLFPLSITMDVIKGLQSGLLDNNDPNLIIPGVNETPDNTRDHLWVQFSPVSDQATWYTIQPKHHDTIQGPTGPLFNTLNSFISGIRLFFTNIS